MIAVLLAGCSSAPGEPTPTRTATTTPSADHDPRPPGRTFVRRDRRLVHRRAGTGRPARRRSVLPAVGPQLAVIAGPHASTRRRSSTSAAPARRRMTSCRAAPDSAGTRPQIAAVRADTDLVTVGIGGNDGNLFASLISACTGGQGACEPFSRDSAPTILRQTVADIATVLDGRTRQGAEGHGAAGRLPADHARHRHLPDDRHPVSRCCRGGRRREGTRPGARRCRAAGRRSLRLDASGFTRPRRLRGCAGLDQRRRRHGRRRHRVPPPAGRDAGRCARRGGPARAASSSRRRWAACR